MTQFANDVDRLKDQLLTSEIERNDWEERHKSQRITVVELEAKLRELKAEVMRWKKLVSDAHLLFEDMQDRAEAAKAKVARVQWTVKKWKALDGLSITVGEVLTDCANEITEALQEPEHD